MTIGDLYDADNVIVGQAAVFFGPKGLALPALSGFNTADPFDETFWTGGTAPNVFSPVGATDQGWQFSADKNTQVINIEEQSTPVGTTITSQSVTLAGSLAEDITRTLALALNANAATHAATATDPGYDDVVLSDAVLQYAVGMVTTNPEGFGRIIYAPAWTQLSNAQTSFRRASDKRLYPVTFATVCKPTDIVIRNFTAAKTS